MDGDGKISRSDLDIIVNAVYQLAPPDTRASGENDTGGEDFEPLNRVQYLATLLGIDPEGEVSAVGIESFRDCISKDERILEALSIYDGMV